MKNKLNLVFALILCIGIVCGCNYSYDIGGKKGGSKKDAKVSRTDEKTRRSVKDDETNAGDDEQTSEENDESNDEDNSSADAGDIDRLVGKWVWARTGSGTYDGATGGYVGGSGSRFTYEFSPNGTVELNGIMNVMMGGCSQQVFTSKKGRASLSGGTLTINWSGGTTTRDFSCDSANNYTKNLPAETQNLQIRYKTDSSGQENFCTGTGSGENCFSPAE